MLRKALWKQGFRYRINDKRLPGSPDIVLPKYRSVIFVHGCFWHGHECENNKRQPTTNAQFWKEKIERNRERDAHNQALLQAAGWHVIVIWECQLSPKRRMETLRELDLALSRIVLEVNAPRPVSYSWPKEGQDQSIAAEPE